MLSRLTRLATTARFSLKKQKRVDTQIQEEKQQNTFQNLESVVDQPDYTEDEIQDFVNKRIEFVKEISKDKNIPLKALIGTGLLALPLVSMTGGLFYAINSGVYLNYVPPVFTACIKYIGITTCFQAGVHWGVGMSLHEQQLDATDSSSTARAHFILSSIPIFTSMAIINYIGYIPDLYQGGLQALAMTNLYILGLDIKAVKAQQLPRWWLKLRIMFLALYLGCVGGLAYLTQTHPALLRAEHSVYSRIMQSKDQLLKK